MTAPRAPRYAGRRVFWVVVGVALAIRLVHLFFFAHNSPFFDPAPWSTPDNPLDTGEYDRWGMQIAHGDAWWTDHGQGAYFQSPVYPYFVAAVYLLLGGRSVLGVALVQALLGAVTCGWIALAARRGVSPAAGWMAGVVACLYAPAIFEGSFLLKEPLAAFFTSGAVLLSLREFGPDGRSLAGESRWPAWLLVGLAWGASVATAPVVAPSALVVGFWAVWRIATARAGRRPIAPPAAAMLCGVFLAILPCTVRNVVGEGRFVLISDAGTRNWDVGNSTNSTGTYIDFPKERLPVLSPAFGRLYLRKLGLFFRGGEIPQVTDFDLLRDASPVLRLPLPGFGFVVPFAVAGLALTLRRWRDLAPLHAPAILYPMSVASFFVVGRFRLPVTPVLIMLAAAAADDLRGSVDRIRLALAAAGIILLGAVVNVDRPLPHGVYPLHHAFATYHLEMAEIDARNGRPEAALESYDQVLRLPSRRYAGLAHAGRARVYLLPGVSQPAEALRELRLSLAADPSQKEAEPVREAIRRLEAGARGEAR